MDLSLFRQLFMQLLPRQVVLCGPGSHKRHKILMQAEIADKLMELESGSHIAAVTTQPINTPSSTAQSAAQSDIAAFRAEIAALTHRLDQQDTRGRSSASDHGSRCGSRSNTPDRDIIYAFITLATERRLPSADPGANFRETTPPGTDGHRLSWPCHQWSPPVRPRPCEQPSL